MQRIDSLFKAVVVLVLAVVANLPVAGAEVNGSGPLAVNGSPRSANVTGQLVSRGHPDHARDFRFVLNDHPIVAEWNPPARFRFETEQPGVNRIGASHPWYLPATESFLAADGLPVQLTPWQPEYRGKTFTLGGATCRFVGHAGGNNLVGVNSYAACSDARTKGMWMLEIDVCVSGDGIPFLSHDWGVVKSATGLDYGAGALALEQSGQITLLSEVLDDFDWLILDLTHNRPHDVARIVDHMAQHHLERVRGDVFLQVSRRMDYDYIRHLDPSLRISFNLASWSAWGLTNDWKGLIADIVAETDFYVINPGTAVTADMVDYLNGNGLTNTFVPVMQTHSPEEIVRLCNLSPGQMCPMIYSPDLIPNVWPMPADCPPAHPLFRFSFEGTDPLENDGDAAEIAFKPVQNVTRTADGSGGTDGAILLQRSPESFFELTSESVSRLNAHRSGDFTMTVSARATRHDAPQVLAMAMQSSEPRYVAGFYLAEGSASFVLTHPDGSQTSVPAGFMADGGWHRLTATVGNGLITTYQDGLVVTGARPGVPLVGRPITSFWIGRDSMIAGRTFDGALDELAWYPYALSYHQVFSLENRESLPCLPGALAEWPVLAPADIISGVLADSSRADGLPLVLRPENDWQEDRDVHPRSSLCTKSGEESGAFLDPLSISRLNRSMVSTWTISGWVKLARTSGTQFLWGGQNRDRRLRYHLGWASYEGTVQFFVRPRRGEQIVAEAGALDAGGWHHLAVTCDGVNLRTYMDGDPTADIPLDPPLLTLDQLTDFCVGFDPVDPSRTADSCFDELRILPFPLTAEEVAIAASASPALR